MDFLKQIESSDISHLINDLELIDRDYEINYIIDAGDIFEFTFPYGINFDRIKDKTLDIIGDGMIAYSYIFDNYRPIVLDEYKLELLASRNYIHTNFSEHINKNLYDELINSFKENDQTHRKKIYKELEKSTSFLLSSALLGKSFLDHFDDVFHNSLQIDTFHLKNRNAEEEEIILEIFKKNTKSSWSELAFREWVKIKEKDKKFRKKSQEQIHRAFRNAYLDFVVIDRICNINNELENSNSLKGKYCFLYFSSANKSNDIFLTKTTKEHLPTINGKHYYDILRSAKHAYLMFLFWDSNPGKIKKDLIRLKEIADTRKRANLLEKIKEEDRDLFERIRAKKRAFLEEKSIEFQINKHTDFQNSLREKIIELEEIKGDPYQLSRLYKSLLEKAIIAKENIGLLDFDITYSVQSKLSFLLDLLFNEKELNLHKGLDCIEGNYQHLPILLFLNKKFIEDDQLILFLRKVIEYVVKSPKIRSESVDEFFEAIKELYAESEEFKKADLNYSGILVKGLIYLILPYKDKGKSQEEEAYNFISETFTTLKYRKDLVDIWEYDYLYFLIWATRRSNLIDESLKLAENGIAARKMDPRFHHGKCLALYNKYVNPINLNAGKVDVLELLIESGETAVSLYEGKIETQQYKQGYRKFIKGSVIALQNTFLYCFSLLHLDALERKIENPLNNNAKLSKYDLIYLRELMNNIQTFEKNENQQDSKDFPELAHTEAVLELCEAISDFNSSIPSDKILNSSLVIERALDTRPDSLLFKNTKKKIDKWKGIIKSA